MTQAAFFPRPVPLASRCDDRVASAPRSPSLSHQPALGTASGHADPSGTALGRRFRC